MKQPGSQKLTIRADRPTAITSAVYGSNLDVISFNIDHIAQLQPLLAIEVMKLYIRANRIQKGDSPAHEEDVTLAQDYLEDLMSETFED